MAAAALNRDLPMQTRQAGFVPASVDLAARTVDLVWSTGAPVMRYDFWSGENYEESLSLDPDAVDLTRMNSGAPLLNSHNASDLGDIIGVVVPGSASVDGKKGTCTVQFSSRADVEPFFQDVVAGIIRNVSVGYSVQEYQVTEAPGQVTQYRATRWTPMENSLVPIPADAGAGTRGQPTAPSGATSKAFPCALVRSNPTQETKIMDPIVVDQPVVETRADPAPAVVPETPKAPTPGELRTLALALSFRGADVDAFIVSRLESGKPMKQIRKEEIDAAAQRQAAAQPINGITITRDAVETKREGMAEYIMHRGNPGVVKLDKGREFRGLTMIDLAKECLSDAGIAVRSLSRMEIATLALNMQKEGISVRAQGEGISDLPNIVLDAANKLLRQAYQELPQTFKAFSRMATAPDFKNINRIMMSNAPSLLAVGENQEIKRGYISDSKETYQLGTYARIIPISRQVIINDDMDALTRLPMAVGRAASRLESDTVWAMILSNPNMADGNAVFSTQHKNLSASNTVISASAIGLGVSAMGIQVGLQGEILNLAPEYLVGPKALDIILRQITSANYAPVTQATVNPYVYLKPITEGRLDNGVGGQTASKTGWYLFAGIDQIDTIEYTYLEGQEGVYMESRIGWDVDGLELKGRLDFASKFIDYRGMYFNPGA